MENKVSFGPPIKLAQPSDSMFERNIAIIASRKNQVFAYSNNFVFEGFLCGLDDQWVQLYGHEEDEEDPNARWRFILLGRNNISGIIPSGRTLYDVENEKREYIDKKIRTFSEVSEKFLNSKEKNDNSRREKL
jgi:hypothetical protein